MQDEGSNAWSRDVAQRILNTKPGEAVQARIADLAGKCNEGLLTPTEQSEYESLVKVLDMISVLQAKARV